MKLGCIADDFTGATDLANNLVRAGMRVVQAQRRPRTGEAAVEADIDAVVVALKSRTIDPAEAVAQSLAACRFLRAGGATQIYFKVCSTFDSTARGNIGPVLEALMDELGCRFTIATPAFPDNGRTVFKGHLFVGDLLLSESGMRHHPLTPMTDANLVRVLQAQLAASRGSGAPPRRVGLVDHRSVAASSAAIGERFAALEQAGVGDRDRRRRRQRRPAAPRRRGQGSAAGLRRLRPGDRPAGQLRDRGLGRLGHAAAGHRLPRHRLGQLLGATNAQVAQFLRAGGAARQVDALALGAGPTRRGWSPLPTGLGAGSRPGAGRCSSTAPPRRKRSRRRRPKAAATRLGAPPGAPARRGRAPAGRERRAPPRGRRRRDLGRVRAGARRLAPAHRRPDRPRRALVPRRPGARAEGLHLALKSGNFGGVDFFDRAFTVAT